MIVGWLDCLFVYILTLTGPNNQVSPTNLLLMFPLPNALQIRRERLSLGICNAWPLGRILAMFISSLGTHVFFKWYPTVSTQRSAGSCDAESGLASWCSTIYTCSYLIYA